jgi:hypothetical protein
MPPPPGPVVADEAGGGGGGGSPPPPRSPAARTTSLLSEWLEAKGELRTEEEVLASHLPPATDLRPRVGERRQKIGGGGGGGGAGREGNLPSRQSRFSPHARSPHPSLLTPPGKLPMLTKLAYGAPSLATSSLSFLVK